MKPLPEIKTVLTAQLADLRRQYHIRELGIFGSYARQQQTSVSDVDILVEFDEVPGLFDFYGLEDHLENLLGIPVDLVRKAVLRPELKEQILREVVYL